MSNDAASQSSAPQHCGAPSAPAPDARRIQAALANDRVLALYARAVLGQVPASPNARERRDLEQLCGVGLLERTDDGFVPADAFRRLLAAERTPAATGVERFLESGKVRRWPSRAQDTHELIAWIIGRCLEPGQSLAERELNERIRRYSEDPALVRRHGVDHGLLLRTADGASYSRPEGM